MTFLGKLELFARIPHRIFLKTAEQRVFQIVEMRHVGFGELAIVAVAGCLVGQNAVVIVRPDKKLHTHIGSHYDFVHGILFFVQDTGFCSICLINPKFYDDF